MLYVQALLLGQQPLHGAEMELLHRGLLGLIEAGLEGRETKGPRGDPAAS